MTAYQQESPHHWSETPTGELTVPTRLPVLSLWRPWPALVFTCGKNVENRTWSTSYRGDLLIAAGVRWDNRALPFAADLAKLEARMGQTDIALDPFFTRPDDHPAGIVGVVELYDVCSYAAEHPGEACTCPPWAALGRHHWRIRNPRPFAEPVPHHGYQRLWQVSDQKWPAVAEQLQEVSRA